MPHPNAKQNAASGTSTFSQYGITQHATAGIVHDLGNLIQVAASALNRVAREPGVSTAPALQPVVASAQTALQRAGALVRHTIIRARTSHDEIEQTDVKACLDEIRLLFRAASDANVQIEVRSARTLPWVLCDRLGLQSAVLNLVFNARDAMPDGGLIAIDATTIAHDAGALVQLRVEDSGIGMTAETMVRAFEPFFTTKGDGLGGVGLPMVKRFAEAHGGSVDIESSFGFGTTVILRLPAAC